MRRLISLIVVFVVMLVVPSAVAQGPDIFVTPVPNNPFAGAISVERQRVQDDGNIVSLKTTREIGRDSRGRIFNESRTLVPAAGDETPQLVGVHIYDPETRVNTLVNFAERTFRTNTTNRPPEMVPPTFLSASSGLNTLPQNQFTREEDLGNKTIDGLTAHGVRQTQTISMKDGKSVAVTEEYWYSEELRINLVVKHNDPRSGSVTMTVSGVKRSEPDPSRFSVPEGFTRLGVQR